MTAATIRPDRDANLVTELERRLEHRFDATFLRSPDGSRVGYGGYFDRVARMAGALAELGVGPGDRVMAQVAKSTDALALYLAALRAGAIYVPLNTAYTAAEIAFFLDDASPNVFVTSPDDVDAVGSWRDGEVVTLGVDGDGTLAGEADRAVPLGPVPRAAGDRAAMLYTSGTTGRPKGAVHTHGSLLANGRGLHDIWQFGPDDVLLHLLPVFHVHGLFVSLHCSMLSGSEVLYCPRFEVEAALDLIGEASVLMGVPTYYARLLADERFTAERCRSVRLFTSGSAPMTELVHAEFTQRTGHRIVERYGMTEAGIISSNPIDGERIPGTVGYALPDTDIRVCDDSGTELPPGETGIVETRGPGLFEGYWGLPDKTAEAFRDRYLITGDVGRLSADGRLTLEGRASDLIISGGLNVYPKEVELALDEIPGIAESAVVGVPDDDFGERVVAFVVLDTAGADGSSPDADELDAAIGDRLASFKRPKHYAFVDELPRNAMGKVQKNQLRQLPI